jgi:integrase
MRRSELNKLKWGDFNFDNRTAEIIGKASKTRIVPINNRCMEIIVEIKSSNVLSLDERLFNIRLCRY